MAKWYVAAKKADFNGIGARFHINPVLARIIRNRDIQSEEEIEKFLYGKREDMYPPFLLADMDQAVEVLLEAIASKEQIRIIGDYDIDGVCSTHILRRGLRFLGADVDTAIPHRVKDGYGINEQLVRDAAKAGVRLLITCDNGIAAAEQIATAYELGMRVIVTDHHEVPYENGPDGEKRYLLPKAEAVVDPKRADCAYPFSGICGAVVAYKVIEALFQQAKEERHMAAPQEQTEGYDEVLDELFEFAAFATVGDVMELRDENRIIVKHGLERMRHSKNPGLRALMQVNGLEGAALSAYHIGFVLGPCLNASGRLDTAERALALLEETDENEAVRLAGELKRLNDSRKDMTAKNVDEACALLERKSCLDDVLIVYLPDCHESLAGIVAGRIREKYGHPVFVLTRGEEGVKGSGRSIEAYDMYAHMTECKELFLKFGGHKMAAGLSMKEEDVEEFRKRMNENSGLAASDFEERVHIDVPMPFSYVTMELVEELSLLEPFGNGNPKPLFAEKNMTFLTGRIMGKNRNVVKFVVADEQGRRYELVYFGDLPGFFTFVEEKFGQAASRRLQGEETAERQENGMITDDIQVKLSVAYYPSINEFRGRRSLQFVMQNYCL